MTVRECPRCHGGKYNDGVGFVPPKKPKLTLSIDNVLGASQRILWKCNNCGYKERESY